MKKVILIVIVVGMLGWAVYDFFSSADENENSQEQNGGAMITSPPKDDTDDEVTKSGEVGISKGDIAPDFELKNSDGETVRLSDYRGERVLVNFWATWCAPCRAEIPDLQKLHDNKHVTILAINLTESEKGDGDITDFVEEFKMTFPILMDANSEASAVYQVQAYPTSYMIDSNGRIKFIALGAMNYDIMVRELEKLK